MRKKIKLSFLIVSLLFIVPIVCFAEETIYTSEDNVSTISLFDINETMKNNYGNITTNRGTIDYNHNDIETNEGIVKNNFSVIRNNTGTVLNNYSYNLLKNDGIVINDYIMSTSNRNYLNAQNTFYLVNFEYLNNEIVEIKWNGPIDADGNYYYGVSTNLDESKRGASFSVNLVDEGYEFKGIESGSATLTEVGKNIYEISYDEEKKLDMRIKYLPIVKEISNDGGRIIRTGSEESYENSYMYISYSIVPDVGYEIVDVLVNNQSIGSVEQYSLYDVTTPTTIKAVFRKIQPPVPNTHDNGISMWIVSLISALFLLIALFIADKKHLEI